MVTVTLADSTTDSIPTDIENRIAGIRLSAHFDVQSPEPVDFLKSVSEIAHKAPPSPSGRPSAQDIECLRQAAWKYSRQTAMPEATGRDLVDVLSRLGYV